MKKRQNGLVLVLLVILVIGFASWAVIGQVRNNKLQKTIEQLQMDNSDAWEKGWSEDLADEYASTVVAEYDGGEITLAEVMRDYEVVASLATMMGDDSSEYLQDAKYDIIDTRIEEELLENKARELGVYELNADEEKVLEERVKLEFEDNVKYYMEYRFDAEKSEAQLREDTIAFLKENGMAYEDMLLAARKDAWQEKLRMKVTENTRIDDAQMREFYLSQVASAELRYSASYDEYEADADVGRTMVWNPEGVRRVLMIEIPFNTEQSIEYLSLRAAIDEGDASKTAALDALWQSLEPSANELLVRLKAGEVLAESVSAHEVRLSKQSTLYDSALIEAAFKLNSSGELSEPIRTDGGLCILKYIADVPAGAVPYDEVKDELLPIYEEEQRSSDYNAAVMSWIDNANVKYYLDRFQ